MKDTANQIRHELKRNGITSRMVSVLSKASYQIVVTTKSPEIKKEDIMRIASGVYYAKPHHWLCCWVDGRFLA